MKNRLIDNGKFAVNYKNIIVITSVFLAAVFLTAAAVQSYLSTKGYILDKLNSINIGIVEQTANTIENNFSQLEKITKYIASDDILIDYIRQYESSSAGSKPALLHNIKSRIGIMNQFNKLIYNVVVVTDSTIILPGADRGVYNLSYPSLKRSEYMKYISQAFNGKAVLIPPLKSKPDNLSKNGFGYIESRYCYASVIKRGGSEYGCVFVLIEPEVIDGMLSNSCFLIDETRIVASSAGVGERYTDLVFRTGLPEPAKETKFFENSGFKIYCRYLTTIGMSVVFIQKNSDFANSINKYGGYLFITLIIIILLALFLSRIISSKIIFPLKQLIINVKNYVYENGPKPYKRVIRNERRGLSLRESILGYLMGVIIVPVSVYLVISYFASCNIIESYVVNSYSGAFRQAVENVNYFINTKEKIMKNIIFNITLQESLSRIHSPKDVRMIVESSLKLGSGRDEIFIYKNDKEIFFTNSNEDSNTVINKKMLEECGYKRGITSWFDTAKDEYGRSLLNLVIKINSLEDFNNIGFLQCQIAEYELENIYKNIIEKDTRIFIVNENGTIISHTDKNLLHANVDIHNIINGNENRKAAGDKFILHKKLLNTPWYLVGEYSFDLMGRSRRTLLYERIYIFTLMLLLNIIIAFVFAFSLTGSLDKMNRLLRKMRIKNSKIIFPQNSSVTEINELGNAFNEMILKNEQLIDQLLSSAKKHAELENRKRESELTALQFQINPHFLYNTFESINWLIKRERKKDAVEMINSLSCFFRHVARSDDPVVMISEEIEHINHYIKIMKMRYGDQIDFIWDIDQELMACKTIRLSLQPVIENAIYHGIHPKQSEGIIEVGCKTSEDGSSVIFSVTDNGMGIPENIIKKVAEEIDNDEAKGSIGLHNIQSRIKLYFGKKYGISIFSREGIGTTVEILIPKNL